MLFTDIVEGDISSMRAPLYSVQGLTTGKVSIMARPRGGDWLFDEIKDLHTSGVDVLVSLLTEAEVSELDLVEEAACCWEQGMQFISFAIVDLSVPPFSEQTFQVLRRLKAYLSAGKHITFHCRAGIGRSSLMAASLLVLTGLTAERAFDFLSQARGYSVPETAEQRAWVVAFAQTREKYSIFLYVASLCLPIALSSTKISSNEISETLPLTKPD